MTEVQITTARDVPKPPSKKVGETWNGYEVWASVSSSLVSDNAHWPHVSVHPPAKDGSYVIFLNISFNPKEVYTTADEALEVAERVAENVLGQGLGQMLDDLVELKTTGKIAWQERFKDE